MRNLVNVKNAAFCCGGIVLITTTCVWFFNKNESKQCTLGSCKTPTEAMQKTHDALQLVSENINTGIKNAYVIEKIPNNKQ